MQIRSRGFVVGAAFAAMLGAAATGCGRAQAKTPGPTPSLAVPEPPSRLVIPVPVEPPASASTSADKPAPAPARPAGARPTPAPTPSPTPTATATPPPTETLPPPVLQTAASLAELEARARDRLGRAEKDLAGVSRSALGADARDQFDSANRFIRMAKAAIGAKNFVYAAYCADKAATLASLLVK